MTQVEQAHQNLKNILLNGRILVSGLPLTANEIAGILQGEQLLFEKAFQFEAEKTAKKPEKKPDKSPKKKE